MARQHIVKDGWRTQWKKFVGYESKVTPYNSITDATSEELGREAMLLYDWAEQNPVVATRCLSMELRMADWGVEELSAASSPSVDSDQSIDDDGGRVERRVAQHLIVHLEVGSRWLARARRCEAQAASSNCHWLRWAL